METWSKSFSAVNKIPKSLLGPCRESSDTREGADQKKGTKVTDSIKKSHLLKRAKRLPKDAAHDKKVYGQHAKRRNELMMAQRTDIGHLREARGKGAIKRRRDGPKDGHHDQNQSKHKRADTSPIARSHSHQRIRKWARPALSKAKRLKKVKHTRELQRDLRKHQTNREQAGNRHKSMVKSDQLHRYKRFRRELKHELTRNMKTVKHLKKSTLA